MKKTLFLTALCLVSFSLFTACVKDDPQMQRDDFEEEFRDDDEGGGQNNSNGDGQGQDSNGNDNVTYPDCFVYYPGAKFIYKRTIDNKTSSKFTWTVTDYEESTKTATIVTQYTDSDPGSMQIRSMSNGMIAFSSGGTFKPVVNEHNEVGYMFNYKPSIPSGIYGSLTDKVEIENISVPGGKSSVGISVGASYQPYTGFHDSYLWDWKISESWCSECGFVRASSFWSNGKEYPISSSRTNIELLAYDIPMPDGTHRSYMPSDCETYDVTDTYCTYFHHSASSQRYDSMGFYWNDKKNKNVMRYTLNTLWYEDGWNYARLAADTQYRTELSGWFKGEKSWGQAIGGPRDGEMFDCSGRYGTQMKSAYYLNEGYYLYCVLVENIVNEGVPTEDTEFILICRDYENDCVGSVRVVLLDNGVIDAYDNQSTQTRAAGFSIAGITINKPDPSMIDGPVHKLK